MEAPHLWLIDRDGRSFIVNLRDNSWKEVSTPELKSRNCFKRISAVSSCAWAINANQQPCLYVHATQVPIRARVETWENQRWGLMNGWSVKSMFRSDRYHFSSKDGKQDLPQSGFMLPSMYWTWESDWYINRKVPGDIEGWQYAIDFPRTYYAEKGQLSCVRRRCWSRYYKFDGYDRWLLIEGLSDDPVKQPFQDIAIGGTMIPGQKPGHLSVWAVTFHGQVIFRAGITDKNPEGEKWVDVPPPGVTITQISVSRTGVLWGVSWEGIAVVRIGVTYYQPTGTQWVEVNPPSLSPNNEICQLLQVSVGVNGVWALTKDEQVWFRKGVNTSQVNASIKEVTGTSWIQMVGRFLLLSVGPNDQVFGLSTCGDHIYFRTDVTQDEMCGRQWRALRTGRSLSDIHGSRLKSSNTEDSDDGAPRNHDNTSLPRYVEFLTWINSGACDVDATFFNDNHRGLLSAFTSMSLSTLDDRDTSWRKDILRRLRLRDQQQVNAFGAYEEAISQGTWSKKARCQILMDTQFNLWSDSVIKLNQEKNNKDGELICYYEKSAPYLSYGELRIPFSEITCVSIIHKMARHNCMAVFTSSRTLVHNPLLISFPNEKELNDWLTTLSSASMQAHGIQGTVPSKALWATSSCGDVFVSESLGLEGCAQSHRFWRQIGGHLSVVQAGTGGVVWGIGFDGNPYVYTGGYGGGVFDGFLSSSIGIHKQEDYDVHFIYENQRWNPVEGFSDRRLPSDRYVWSDKSGVYERTKEGFLLPSSQWQWMGNWQIDTRPGTTDNQGWQYAVDFPRHYHAEKNWNDYVRRRRWRRRCKLTTTGPWLLIQPTVKLRDVSVQIDDVVSDDEEISMWVVGSQGDVLYRHGVTKACPQGHSWQHIIADVPFRSISVGGEGRVWGVAEDGTSYFRAGFADNEKTGSCWFHIADRPPYLVQVSAGASSVWARDKEGTLWYRINISDVYPEGTEWIEQGHVSHLSTGPNDQVS
ncbi:tectonin beta-propeller repeat-containing protein 1-like [Actinia tenebrosa]|uniref:Tectonin beta-propeller repeat-containing protein 1-like n=1 Tax=Actinia tenebrosa TaxID=6105 RepID=A0A6P8I2K2_ACTTE|nr:tectonin beta-propeller repeat-containing protein 1-like [Actinia tenebrosa]